MFELNIPYKIVNNSINRFFVGTKINSIERSHYPRYKVKAGFDIKKDRIIVNYPSRVTTLQNRVLNTAIAYSKEFASTILVGIPDKKGKLAILMNVALTGFRTYEIEVKDAKSKILLKGTYKSKRQLVSDLSKIVI